MFNNTVAISRTYSSSNINVDNKQDINPISEQKQDEVLITQIQLKDRDKRQLNKSELCRCANCGYLSIFDNFGTYWDYQSYITMTGCPRCKSKAIFLINIKKEKDE